jgi:hypothetical protein
VSYEQHLKNFLEHVGDLEVSQLKSADIHCYLAWLRTDYQPQRFTGSTAPLTPKTIRNFWVSLSAFFSWVSRELELPNPMKNVPGRVLRMPRSSRSRRRTSRRCSRLATFANRPTPLIAGASPCDELQASAIARSFCCCSTLTCVLQSCVR